MITLSLGWVRIARQRYDVEQYVDSVDARALTCRVSRIGNCNRPFEL